MGIPHTLHQIWIGPDPRPNDWIETWRQEHPDWSHYVWDEQAINMELMWMDGIRKVYDQYIKEERFCGAANVVRALILEQFGGVYIDADMVCRHRLDDAWFMRHEAWVSQSPHEPTRSQNAAMGTVANNVLFSYYVNSLDLIGRSDGPIHPSWQKTGAVLFDQVRAWGEGITPKIDVAFVPSPAFHPKTKSGKPNPALYNYEGQIYAMHHFYSTHGRKRTA